MDKFDLPILPSDQCLKTLREKNLWGSTPFPANNLCTSGERANCRVMTSASFQFSSCTDNRTQLSVSWNVPFKFHMKFLTNLLLVPFRQGSDADRGTGMFCPVPEKDGQPLGTSKRYVQVGVSSWGQGCSGQPGMYTNVPFFSTWLQKAVVEQLAA